MEEKKNKGLYIVIIILTILLICSLGYIVYNEFIKENEIVENNEEKEDNNLEDEQTKKEKISENTLNDLNNIIENELYVLWDKSSIEEITNQEKLQVALLKLTTIKNLSHYSEIKSFSTTEIENAFKETSLGYLQLNHETIHPFYKLSVSNEDGFTYDKNNQMYTNVIFGSDTEVIEPYESLLKESYYENGKYYISYQFIWTIYPDIGDMYYSLYYSYDDANNRENSYFSGDDEKGELEEYIINNKEKIMENTENYNYVFEKENNNFILIEFNKTNL